MNELHAQLKSDFELHRKSRELKHALYPERFVVPDALVSWGVPFEGYAPVEFNAPVVLDARTPWADPQEVSKVSHPFTSFMGEVKFNDAGRPLNPVGRTGLCGRGVLGKWGANFAVDSILTTVDSDGLLVVLTIIRKDTGERAFPGAWSIRERMCLPPVIANWPRNLRFVSPIWRNRFTSGLFGVAMSTTRATPTMYGSKPRPFTLICRTKWLPA